MRRALAAVVAASMCAGVATAATTRQAEGLHDARYCEIIELKGAPPDATATVWNTIGLNDCPEADWRAFDASALAAELGDSFVLLNGPRHFLMDSASASTGRVRSFHGMRMREVARIPLKSAADVAQVPYADRTISRTNTWRWRRGRTVFELVAPGGDTYVMQSYAQIADPGLTLAKLRSLGARLKLPLGWRYRARRLARPLVLAARGRATILQDELKNTYQLATTARRGKRTSHRLALSGRTRTVPPATPGTIEDHGIVSGKPFGKGRIVLVGKLDGGSLSATFRLTFARGSVIGTATLPFTLDGNDVTFKGTSRITGGTGAFRGISSGPLRTLDTNTLDGQSGRLGVRGAVKY